MPLLKKGEKRKSLRKPRKPPDTNGWPRKDVVLIPVMDVQGTEGFPVCNSQKMPVDDTYFAVDQNGKPESLVTKTARGTYIAWEWCGLCRMPMGSCGCKHGPLVTRSVEHIYDKDQAEVAGEQWGMDHPNYKGSFREARRKANQNTGRLSMPPRSQGVTPKGPERPSKPLRKHGQAEPAPVQEKPSQRVLDETATKQAAQTEGEVLAKLSKPVKKPLKRAKKPLRKRQT